MPLIIRWPKKVKAGRTSDETVCLSDFMATFADILKVQLPHPKPEDSYSLLPILLSQSYQQPIRPATVHHSGSGAFAIRKGDWKQIFGKIEENGEPEVRKNWTRRGYLFNLNLDPSEQKNVYKDQPEMVAEMNALLESYLAEDED